MNYRRLGNSGLKISEVGLGGWLTLGGHLDDALSVRIIEHAFFCGINLFDVADVYSQGHSEVVLGKAAKELPRDQMVVATKVFGRMHEGPFGAGLSKKHILQACDASLKRLGMDTIDLYQFHLYDDDVPLEESLEAMDILVQQGKVLYVGCSNFDALQIREGLDIASRLNYPRFISNQPRYNMLDRGIEDEVLPLCGRQGVGNIVYSPLAEGVLTGKYRKGRPYPEGSRMTYQDNRFESPHFTDENLHRVEKIGRAARSLDVTLPALALAWVLRRPEVSSALMGVTSIRQLDENVNASRVELTADVIERLEGILA